MTGLLQHSDQVFAELLQELNLTELLPAVEAVDAKCPQKFTPGESCKLFSIIQQLAVCFLTRKHNKLYVRSDLFPEWQRVRFQTTPLPILAAAAKSQQTFIGRKLLAPLVARNKVSHFPRGLSECHLHATAYYYPEEQWLNALHDKKRISLQVACALNTPNTTSGERSTKIRRVQHMLETARFIRESLIFHFKMVGENCDIQHIRTIREKALSYLSADFPLCEFSFYPDRTLNSLYQDEIFLWRTAFGLHRQKHPAVEELEPLLYLYLLMENDFLQLYRGQVSDNGLEAFGSLAHAPSTLEKGVRYYRRAYSRLMQDTNFVLGARAEVRLSPGKESSESKASPYLKWQAATKKATPKPDVALHLIKKGKIGSVTNALMKRYQGEASRIPKMVGENNLPHITLDAAGATLNVPAEVFAPAYLDLKGKVKNRTFHCGEDFRHLLSGIREVEESIRFFELGSGDRLGHAMSIGVLPEQWLSTCKGEIEIPRREWFLNLLYLLHLHPSDFPEDNDTWQWAEKKQLWLNEARQLAKELLGQEASNNASEEFFCAFYRLRPLFNKDVTNQTGKKAQELGKKWNNLTHDKTCTIPAAFLPAPVLLALQQRVQRLILERDLVVEVCPVSNCKIGVYKSLAEHHIFRWLHLRGCTPAGDSRMKLCIGCDDPGIFITNTANEYYLLICLLRRRGLKPRTIRRIINRLNEQGNHVLRSPRLPKYHQAHI